MTNIFTTNGRIDASIDPLTIAPDQRDAFIALAAAQTACEQAESDQKAADDAVAQAVREYDRAHAALPKSDFLTEWRRSTRHATPTDPVVEIDQSKSVEVQQPVDPVTALKDAERALDSARWDARQCRAATGEARSTFAKALENWNRTLPVWTQDQQARAYIATNLAERARKAEAGLLRRPTTVGEMAKALAGGGHNVQRGGGRSYRRGAFSKAEALEFNANRLRAATVAAKLPSQR